MNPLLPQDFERGYQTAIPLPEEWILPNPWWMSPWLLALASILFLCLLWMIIQSLRREALRQMMQPPQPRDSALEALQFLRKEHATLPPSESVHRLSDLIRMYLQHRLRIPARSLATQELRTMIEDSEHEQPPLYSSKSSSFSQSYHPVIKHLVSLLEKCDSFQFRAERPKLDQQTITTMMREAENLIKSDPVSPSKPFDPSEMVSIVSKRPYVVSFASLSPSPSSSALTPLPSSSTKEIT